MDDVIAIDGPVGVGKSSVASTLAARLGWRHLDTGAMYRAVALLALRGGVALDDEPACARLAREMKLDLQPAEGSQRVLLGGEDVSAAIRTAEVTGAVGAIADQVAVREELTRRQRELGGAVPSVAEGRDMGTIVFPQARWKFYLDAEPAERAGRRALQLERQGLPADMKELIAAIEERDRRDRSRPVGALRIADGATIVDTTGIDFDRVVGILEALVHGEMEGAA